MLIQRIAKLIAVFLLVPFMMEAQVTTSSISGTVKSSKGDPLAGATITATHIPTGTTYKIASRTGGTFNIFNMLPGGPYTIVTSFVGFNDDSREDVMLT